MAGNWSRLNRIQPTEGRTVSLDSGLLSLRDYDNRRGGRIPLIREKSTWNKGQSIKE